MADFDSKYKDSFVSQDDLDRLMDEADRRGPDAFSAAPETAPPPDDDNQDDVISQDDIDALLNLAGTDSSESPDTSDDEEVISQDDIDALLAGNAPDPKPAPEPDENADFEDETADLDLVSPEDIEKLLQSESDDTPDSPMEAPLSADSDFDTITKEDLEDLSSSMEIKADAAPQSDDGDDDSLISQDDIDALLAGQDPAPSSDNESITAVPVADAGSEEDDSLISQDDIDKLLAGTDDSVDDSSDTPSPEVDDEEDNLISQEDIDKLLIGKSEEAESEETLIDQDDIDRLLSSSAPVDEDLLAGQDEQDKLISQEDIDRLLNEDLGDVEPDALDDEADQVILEKDTDVQEAVEPSDKAPWYRSKLVISAAAMALVLMISITVIVVFTGEPDPDEPQVADTLVEPPPIESETPSNETYPMDDFTPQTYDVIPVSMTGFVIPAPSDVKGLAYIALDISFEISDVPSNPIKDYEPFFRNIVYETVNKAFILQSESKVVEADLKNMIRDALNDALSEGSITSIEFLNFNVG